MTRAMMAELWDATVSIVSGARPEDIEPDVVGCAMPACTRPAQKMEPLFCAAGHGWRPSERITFS
jgi:hypothetical protein